MWELVKQIPRGKVTTYKCIARLLNTSPRAIGSMLRTNPELVSTPCHRVVKSDGSLGGYAGGVSAKQDLLEREGVSVINGRIDLSVYGWCGFNV